MARTTSTLVSGIIETDLESIPDLGPFIDTASELIEEVCTPVGYSDTRLELIERWLAAHFYAIRDQRRETEKAGDVSEKVQTQVGLNFNVTIYGQQALILDTKGGLAKLQKQAVSGVVPEKFGITWLGTSE